MSDFNSSIYFGTPVWTNNVPEFLTPMNKLCDKYIKKAKKDLLPTIKESWAILVSQIIPPPLI